MNYENLKLKIGFEDTIHLMPTTVILDEVVVSNSETGMDKKSSK